MLNDTKLVEMKCELVNRTHTCANDYASRLLKYFTPLVGHKVFTKERQLVKAVREKMPVVDHRMIKTIWTNTSGSVRCCIKGIGVHEGLTRYHQVYIYVGSVDEDGKLISVNNFDPFKTDYSLVEVNSGSRRLKELKEEVAELESRLEDILGYSL